LIANTTNTPSLCPKEDESPCHDRSYCDERDWSNEKCKYYEECHNPSPCHTCVRRCPYENPYSRESCKDFTAWVESQKDTHSIA